jgi:hypothetical protein
VRILALLLLLLSSDFSTAAPVCPAGAAVAYFRLEARRPGAAFSIPIDKVNRLRKGDSVVFFPSDPPVPTDVSGARVALLLLSPATGELHILETKKATARQDWVLPEDAEAIGLAYGPRGLDENRMRQAATKDPELIAQLADYSEKTAHTELVLSALSGRRLNDDRAVEAALLGLAGSGGGAKLDRNGTLDQQTLTLIRTLNPAIGGYDPLAPEPQQRWQQSATLAASVAGLFFGNTVGLAGGGAALFLNLRSLAFPRTELRSALLREAPEPALCAAKASASRTRFAYLWARRLPLGSIPTLQLAKPPAPLAIGLPATLELEGTDQDLAAAGRAFRWHLRHSDGLAVPVSVSVPIGQKLLRIGNIPKSVKPGTHRLTADWDWTTVEVSGDIAVHHLPGLRALRLTADTADRLVSGAGTVRARLAGEPAFFIDSIQLLRLGDPLATPRNLTFATAPDGAWVELELNTADLPPGPYSLRITQRGGARMDLAIALQPPPPAIANLPLKAHRGETQTLQLTGERLERIERIRSTQANLFWDAANHLLRITLPPGAPDRIDLELDVEGRHLPLHLPAALRALDPKPVIQSITRAPQPPGTVERRDGEIDASLPAAFSLQLDRILPGAPVLLICLEAGMTPPRADARPVGASAIYFTVPANGPPGCTLRASIGGSEPVALGKLVTLPDVREFVLTGEPASGPGTFKGSLQGTGLEAIERTGWTPEASCPVPALPGLEAAGQRLQIAMPWPAPAPRAPLRIWLRGEASSRATTARF